MCVCHHKRHDSCMHVVIRDMTHVGAMSYTKRDLKLAVRRSNMSNVSNISNVSNVASGNVNIREEEPSTSGQA
jgi:hypothetical protein